MHETHRLLRQATAPYHARLDAVLGGGFATADDYAAYLNGMRGFLADAADALGEDAGLRRLRALLAADCGVLGLDGIEPAGEAVSAVQPGPARLGWEYVISGASLGARFLLRDARALGFAPGSGASFLAAHAAGDWHGFLERLFDAALPASQLPQLCAGAIDAFVVAERRMRVACGVPA